MKATSYLPLFLAVLLSSSVVALGQTTGTISGTVTDEKGAVITNATVTARNTERNISRNLQTGSDGNYRFENLPVGPYEVSVEATGFSKYVQSGITLVLQQNAIIVPSAVAPGQSKSSVVIREVDPALPRSVLCATRRPRYNRMEKIHLFERTKTRTAS